MEKKSIKPALWAITIPYGLSFLSGALDAEFTEEMYVVIGLVMIGALIWAWVIANKYDL